MNRWTTNAIVEQMNILIGLSGQIEHFIHVSGNLCVIGNVLTVVIWEKKVLEEKFCNKTDCPYYGPWNPWKRNGSEMIRFRECTSVEIRQQGCNSPSIETQPCSGRCERYER